MSLLNISAIFLGPIGFDGLLEKPNPGSEGTITSKESFLFPPNFSGCASFSIISKNSITDPGHPCINNNGTEFGLLPFYLIK